MAVFAFWLPSKVIPFLGSEFILHSENILNNTVSFFKLFFAQPFGNLCCRLASMCAWARACLALTPPPRAAQSLPNSFWPLQPPVSLEWLFHARQLQTRGNRNSYWSNKPRSEVCLALSLKTISFFWISHAAQPWQHHIVKLSHRTPLQVIETEATILRTLTTFQPGLPGLSDTFLCSQTPHMY